MRAAILRHNGPIDTFEIGELDPPKPGPGEILVRVHAAAGFVKLQVVDNGCGFDVEALEERRGMGLQGMRERAEQFGGVFSIESAPSEGTRVRVRMETGKSP